MSSKIDRLIRKGNDPILKVVCSRVERGEYIAEITELMELCCKKGSIKGVGIAAPQVGFSKRIVFINCRDDHNMIRGFFMLNPEIVWRDPDTDVEMEACLSYPGIHKRIQRHKGVEVSYQDQKFNNHRKVFFGYQSRVIQHEVDHLDGICQVGDPAFKDVPEKNAEGMALVATILAVASMGLSSSYQTPDPE